MAESEKSGQGERAEETSPEASGTAGAEAAAASEASSGADTPEPAATSKAKSEPEPETAPASEAKPAPEAKPAKAAAETGPAPEPKPAAHSGKDPAPEPASDPGTKTGDAGQDRPDPARRRREAKAARTAARLAKQITAFGSRHGGARGQLAYLGRRGTRIVLVGEDGGWGDLVAPTDDIARRAAEAAGLALQDTFDGELAARVSTGPYEWKRMAGIQLGGRGAA